MAKAPRTPPADLIDELDDALTPAEAVDQDIEAAILSDLGGDDTNAHWEICVSRTAQKGEQAPYLFKCSPGETENLLDRIRDECGTGSYQIKINRNKKFHRVFTVAVEARKQPPPPPQLPPSTDLAAVLKQAMDQQTALIERLMSARQAPASGNSTLETIQTVMGLLGGFKSFFSPAESGTEKLIDTFMKGIETGKTVEGNKGETGIMDIIRDALSSPLVEKLLQNAGTSAHPMAVTQMGGVPLAMPPAPSLATPPSIIQPAPQSPQPTPQPATAQDGKAVNQQDAAPDPKIMQLYHNIRYLTTKAVANADIDLYADWCLDNIPLEMLQGIVNDPNALPGLIQMVPEAAPYTAWFAQLIQSVKDGMTEPPEEVKDDTLTP